MIVEPPEDVLDPWTARVLKHPRIDAGWGLEETDGVHGLSLALNDRLLVRRIELDNPAFVETLMGRFGASLLGSLTEGDGIWEGAEGPPDGEDRNPDRLPPELDVTIWSLPGRAGGSESSVFEIARELWAVFESVDREARSAVQIAPDYLLAPARKWHLCPAVDPEILDPRDPIPPTSLIPPFVARGSDEEILVIDTDYVPHTALGTGRVRAEVAPTFQSRTGQWVASPRTTGISGGPDLSCHGTFVLGCIASRCDATWRFRVVSINELDRSIDAGDGLLSDLATESTLARVLIQKLARSRRFTIVQCGFAGMPADPRDAAALLAKETGGGPYAIPSFIGLTAALTHIEANRGLSMPVIVAPAGNQQSTAPHFPAADPRVIGVGSVYDPCGPPNYSNANPPAGPDWVDVCSEGTDVVGLFVADDGTEGFARWSGTSFASPKVAALAAGLVRKGRSGPEARDDLLTGAITSGLAGPSVDPYEDMGRWLPVA